MVLSSDKQVRKNAGKLSLEYHGMLWVFDELVLQNHLDTSTAIQLLTTLINQNILYKNNIDFNHESQKRINNWQKS